VNKLNIGLKPPASLRNQ